MKIINLSFADSAGAAYTLAHAINKTYPEHQCINMRANNNYLNYPAIAELRNYDAPGVRRMIEKSDVVIFHTAIKPFYSALQLEKEKMTDKKKLLYFHGSDCRNYGADILKQADEIMGDYEVLVSTPDLLRYVPEAHWMPCCRSFKEILARYSISGRDKKALSAFTEPKTRLTLSHAPTNMELKGSSTFFTVITRVLEEYPDAQYEAIRNLPWASCLSAISNTDIYYDQCVLGAYGLAAVEAAIFAKPIFCLLDAGVIEIMEKETGKKNPFIQWKDEQDLAVKTLTLLKDADLRSRFGAIAHEYCKAVHDDLPVSRRLIKIIESMPG